MQVREWRTADAEVGAQLAAGRDGTIHDAGPGRVLRRLPPDRDLIREALVMEHAGAAGYPVPEVYAVGPGEMVLQLIDGRTMLEDLPRRPWRARRYGRLLAELHRSLHDLAPPAGVHLPAPYGPGRSLLHRDLHPANVMLPPAGPVVIDWTGASTGPGAADEADTWIVLACAESDVSGLMRLGEGVVRAALLRGFLGGIDVDAAREQLPAAARLRLQDHNMRAAERDAIRRLVESETGAPIPADT